jgi:hypothetical protein
MQMRKNPNNKAEFGSVGAATGVSICERAGDLIGADIGESSGEGIGKGTGMGTGARTGATLLALFMEQEQVRVLVLPTAQVRERRQALEPVQVQKLGQ